ncbi:hypothetical protein INR49_023532 [Caranx melampygus]|nr:hypothetical protein INR49_023532 [Caranx melampygus]
MLFWQSYTENFQAPVQRHGDNSYSRLAVAAPQASQTDSLYAEGAMLMLGFVSTAALWMVKALRLEDREP